MEEIIKQIAMLHRLSLICLTGMTVCFIISMILFRRLQIKEAAAFFIRQNSRRIAGKIMILIFWSWFTAGLVLPVKAAQNTEPVLEEFVIQSGSDVPEEALTTEDGVLCYAKNLAELEDIKIKVAINDDAETFDSTKVLLEYRVDGQEKWVPLVSEQQAWITNEQGAFETIYLFDGAQGEENVYFFRVSYKNITVISMQKIVIDKVSPSFRAVYFSEEGEELLSNEEGTSLEPYYNAAREIHLQFNVTEENLDFTNTSAKIMSLDRNGKVLKEEVYQIENHELVLQLTSDAHYAVEIKLVDKAGNVVVHQKTFALDHGGPELSDVTCTLENGDLISRLVNQLTFGFFAKEKTMVHIKACDLVSGVNKIVYTYEDVETKNPVTEMVEVQESEADKNTAELTVELPFSFKGTVMAYGIDKLENTAEEIESIGIIAESQEKHEETSSASVEVKSSFSKTPDYYSGDVAVTFSAHDTYSGVNSISYHVGDGVQETISYENESEIITSLLAKDYVLQAAGNQKNDVVLGLEFTDNAGHTTIVPEKNLPKIHIDTIKPKVHVEYDDYEPQNEKYYHEMRTASIYVTERNFDPEDVHFELSGPNPAISGWSHSPGTGCTGASDSGNTGHTDECVWKCTVEFKEDGDYRFGFYCIDLAGNEGRYDQTDEFVIDKTAPVIKVTYDNMDVQNEFYYNAPRTAVITIEEHNFEPSEVSVITKAQSNKTELPVPSISNWSSTGDVHRALIHYNYDGEFTFDIACIDLAGNESADYAEDYFVVDLTLPEILISEVFDQSANNGIVSPVITVSDINYEHSNTSVQMAGWYHGGMEPANSRTQIANGEMIKIQDFEYVKEMDDLYTLTVFSKDLAGNAAEKEITFSVNRFGSVYTFGKATEKLAGENGTYYANEEIPLVITETNVDTLVHQEIICNLNGKIKTLIKNEDYTVRESGSAATWKQYTYYIEQSNFTEEGHYILIIYSEDRAQNASDNHSKGKKIEFAIDKTKPSILVSGVEEKGQYREDSREITVDVQDNLELSEVKVLLNGEEMLENKGNFIINAESQNTWQTIKVSAIDKAGNEAYSEEIRFLVTPNVLMQFYRNTPVFYGSISFLLLLSILTGTFLWYKRKKIRNSASSS